MNSVQGKYPSAYKNTDKVQDAIKNSAYFPGSIVAGSEGWGRVAQADKYSPFKVGDWVAVGQPGLGTMRSSLWLPPSALVRLPRGDKLSKIPGAMSLFQLGGTAWRMLNDFVDLQEGDTVIQNAGNSAVALMVSQLVHAVFDDVNIVSFVRRGGRSDETMISMIEHLRSFGKNRVVFIEDDMHSRDVVETVRNELLILSPSPPKLALNSVGGKSASLLLKLLGEGGTMVTYGGMSMSPVEVTTSQFIFRDIRLAGYWHSRWMAEHSRKEKERLLNTIVDLALSTDLQPVPFVSFPLSKYREALYMQQQQNMEGIRKKVIFTLQQDRS